MSANQIYFSGNTTPGDYFQCAAAAAAGQSPDSAPANWRRIKIPVKLRWALTQLTYAHLLKLDGQNDKAQTERAIAMQTERVGLDDLVRREANAIRWLERPGVETTQGPV